MKTTDQYSVLRKIDEVTLDECGGKRTIAGKINLFKSFLDHNFKKFRENRATPETKVEVHEMTSDATLIEMFTSLSGDLMRLTLTQDQVVEFCAKHRDKLRTDASATFFLLKEGGLFTVASVRVDGDDLKIYNGNLAAIFIWDAEGLHRVVVPVQPS